MNLARRIVDHEKLVRINFKINIFWYLYESKGVGIEITINFNIFCQNNEEISFLCRLRVNNWSAAVPVPCYVKVRKHFSCVAV